MIEFVIILCALFGVSIIIAAYREYRHKIEMQSALDCLQSLSNRLDISDVRVVALKDLVKAASENNTLKFEDLNLRMIDLETENKITPPRRLDDDPLSGPRAFASQAIEAERWAMMEAIGG